MSNIWTMLEEEAPRGCDPVQDLYSWSLNFPPGQGPISLYLDLIGWSEETYGEPLCDLKNSGLGYVELAKLAAALTAYADDPHGVYAYVEALMEAETRD